MSGLPPRTAQLALLLEAKQTPFDGKRRHKTWSDEVVDSLTKRLLEDPNPGNVILDIDQCTADALKVLKDPHAVIHTETEAFIAGKDEFNSLPFTDHGDYESFESLASPAVNLEQSETAPLVSHVVKMLMPKTYAIVWEQEQDPQEILCFAADFFDTISTGQLQPALLPHRLFAFSNRYLHRRDKRAFYIRKHAMYLLKSYTELQRADAMVAERKEKEVTVPEPGPAISDRIPLPKEITVGAFADMGSGSDSDDSE